MIDVIIWIIALVSALLLLAGAVCYAIVLLGGYDESPAEPKENDIDTERWEDL